MNALIYSANEAGAAFCGFALQMLVQSAILIVILYTLDRFLRSRLRASIRYGIWMLVLIKLMLPTTLSFPTGAGYWLGRFAPAPTADTSQTARSDLPEADNPSATPPASFLARLFPMQKNRTLQAAAVAADSASPSLNIHAAFLALWILGASTLAVMFLLRLVRVRRLVRQSQTASPRCQNLLDACLTLTAAASPALRESNKIGSPAVCGLLHPVILMPAGLEAKLTNEQLETILLHELCHIQRGDLWVNLVQTLLQIIYFYNPFVWLANHSIRRVREQANDERVLVHLGGRRECYHHTLIDVAAAVFRRPSPVPRLLGVMETRNQLNERIKLMIQRPIPTTTRFGIAGTLTIALLAAVLLPMAQHPYASAEPSPQTVASQKPAQPAPGSVRVIRTAAAAALVRTPEQQQIVDAFNGMSTDLVEAVNNGNVNRIVSMFTDNAALLPNFTPPALGTQAITQYYVNFFRENPGLSVLDIQSDSQEFWIAGDLVFAVDEYSLAFKTAAMRYVMTDYQKGLTIFQRQPDGSLSLLVNAENTNPTPLHPDQYQARKAGAHPKVIVHTVETQPLSDEAMAQAIETVKALDREYEQCFLRKDHQAAFEYYADDATLMTVNQPPIRGSEALRNHILNNAGQNDMVDSAQEIIDAGGSNGMIYIVNRFLWQFRDPADPGQVHSIPGKGVHVWQQQPDGSWKILIDIHNTSIPLPQL